MHVSTNTFGTAKDDDAHHCTAQREQRLEKRVQRGYRILRTVLALQPSSIESNVPIRQLVDEIQQAREDAVKPVRSHLLAEQQDEGLTAREDPSVHDVARERRMRVVLERDAGRFL